MTNRFFHTPLALIPLAVLTMSALLIARPVEPRVPSDSMKPTVASADPLTDTISAQPSGPLVMSDASHEEEEEEVDRVVIPTDLHAHRLKIRLDRSLRARLLPDGRLFSLTHEDMSDVDDLLARIGVQLSPAVSIPESSLTQNRTRALLTSGYLAADLGATFWVDGTPEQVTQAAKALDGLHEVEVVSFRRTSSKTDHTPTQASARPLRKPVPASNEPPTQTAMTPSFVDPPSQRPPNLLERLGNNEFGEATDPYIGTMSPAEAVAMLEQNRIEGIDRHKESLFAANEHKPNTKRAVLGGNPGACCFSVFAQDVTLRGGGTPGENSFGPGYIHYCEVVADSDGCDAIGENPDVAHFNYLGDGSLCLGTCGDERFGSCCDGETITPAITGVQDGEDSTLGDCGVESWGGSDPSLNPFWPTQENIAAGNANAADIDDQGGFGVPISADRAYANCESCRLVYGVCCIGMDGIDLAGTLPDNTFAAGPKWAACSNFDPNNPPPVVPLEAFGYPTPVQNWQVLAVPSILPPDPANLTYRAGGYPQTNGVLGGWSQPLFDGFNVSTRVSPLYLYTGGRTPSVSFLGEASTPGQIYSWQGYEVPELLTNPAEQEVVGSSRLVTNNDDTAAWRRCVDMGGAWFEGGAGPFFEIQYEFLGMATAGMDPPDSGTYPELFYGAPDRENPAQTLAGPIPNPGYLCGVGSADPNTGIAVSAALYESLDPIEQTNANDFVLGAFTNAGETLVGSYQDCLDGSGGQGVSEEAIWSSSIIDSKLMNPFTGLHGRHENWMRPMWSIWYSPATNSVANGGLPLGYLGPWETWCPPGNPFNYDPRFLDPLCMDGTDPADVGSQRRPYLVPPWEYIGSEIQWTGWNPTVWAMDTNFFGGALNPADELYEPLPTNEQTNVWNAALPDFGGTPDTNPTGIFAAHITEPSGTPSITEPGHFGPAVRFGLPPTGTEFESSQGLATQRGFPDVWTDPKDENDSWWPVYPTMVRWVYHWQVEGGVEDVLPPGSIYPFTEGWRRWTEDPRMFDIDQSLELPDPAEAGQPILPNEAGQADPDFTRGTRYLNTFPQGTTRWEYLGDQLVLEPSSEEAWVLSSNYILGVNQDFEGEPTRGSCYFPRSDTAPSVSVTGDKDAFPEEQLTYVGQYCDEQVCCEAVAEEIARCCTAGVDVVWDAECVQVAIDIYLQDSASGQDFAQWRCKGIAPYTVPQVKIAHDPGTQEPIRARYTYYPVPLLNPNDPLAPPAPRPGKPLSISGHGTYDSDPQNAQLNPLLSGMGEDGLIDGPGFIRTGLLPRFADPTPTTAGDCDIADESNENTFWPVFPVKADHPDDGSMNHSGQPVNKDGLYSQDFLEYANVRDRAARLAPFLPRCQAIFTSAGQCNVPGSVSGRSSWDAIADDESLITGCQDYACCLRTIDAVLEEKDADPANAILSDVEWINFGHMGYEPGDILPPLAGQWTPYLAMKAREICYPQTVKSDTSPDFFALQIHAAHEAYQRSGSQEWIEGADSSKLSNSSLAELIPAPLSWSDPKEADGQTCQAPQQNIYEFCPRPYYGGHGLSLWPESAPTSFSATPENTFSAQNSWLSRINGISPNSYGDGITIAVLAESALLDEYTVFGQTIGAIHEDLGNVTVESGVQLDFSNPELTMRGTAVLGVIAASNNGIGVTGMAHDADTRFYPTREVPNSGQAPEDRLEEAFNNAINELEPGDIILLAMDAPSGTSFLLSDPIILSLVSLAAANDILVVVPAGDNAEVLPEDTDLGDGSDAFINNILVVGGLTPGADSGYSRSWSSNFSSLPTRAFAQPLQANIAAWGTSVTTTGGNANLSLLTINDAAITNADGSYQLTSKGLRQSYTNDFGNRRDGSIAAAAQIAAVSACAQGFMKTFYSAPMSASSLAERMYDSANLNNGGGLNSIRGQALADGSTQVPGPTGAFGWDLDHVEPADRYVGRIPHLGELIVQVNNDVPDDDELLDDEAATFKVLDLALVTGSAIEGSVLDLIGEEDGRFVFIESAEVNYGPPSTTPPSWVPSGIYYGHTGKVTDVALRLQVPADEIATFDFSVYTRRFGPYVASGDYSVFLYDFFRNNWRQLQPDELPGDTNVQSIAFNALQFPGAPIGLSQYRDPISGHIIARVMTKAGQDDPYSYGLDFIEFQGTLQSAP